MSARCSADGRERTEAGAGSFDEDGYIPFDHDAAFRRRMNRMGELACWCAGADLVVLFMGPVYRDTIAMAVDRVGDLFGGGNLRT